MTKKHPGTGHNSGEVNAGELRAFIERIENVNQSIADLTEDRKEIYAEAKSSGYDPAIIREIVKQRAMDADKRAEKETLFDIYMRALGDFATMPLGVAAIERVSA